MENALGILAFIGLMVGIVFIGLALASGIDLWAKWWIKLFP